MSKLTKTSVDAAGPRDKQFIVWCGELKGFGACVHPTGRVTYVVDYSTAGGRRSRMTLGKHGVVTTEQARKLALAVLGSSVQGEDPLLEKRTRRKSLTISELCDDYISSSESGLVLGRSGKPKKQSSIEADKGNARSHIKPLLGRKLVIDLRQSDVARFIQNVTAGKTAKTEKSDNPRGLVKVTGGPIAAARAAALLGTMMSYARSQGIVEYNPVHGVTKPTASPRTRRLLAHEFKAIGDALEEATLNRWAWQGIAIIRLAAFTGCRIGELKQLKWSEVDIEAQVLDLADSKTGQSTRPLPKAAITVLSAIEREGGNPYVFTGQHGENTHYGGTTRFYRQLFKAAGLAGVTPHVLRHSFASVGADLGFTDSTIGACLGHAGSGITSRYTHRLDSVLIAAANKIADEVENQMTSNTL
jgi:integrase